MRPIDADALIEKYGDWYTEEGTEEGYIGTIKGIAKSMPTIYDAPAAQPELHWIPCSEKLPEKDGFYLISIVGVVLIDYFVVDRREWHQCDKDGIRVWAWQPLPDPYKGGE